MANRERASKLEYLKWFSQNSDFEPTDIDKDGNIEFAVMFYNGGWSLNEALEEVCNKIEKGE
jgi:hypothetical protein